MRLISRRFGWLAGRRLLVRFGVLSAVLVIALGVVLGQRLHRIVERAELNDVSQSVIFTANFAMRGYLSGGSSPLFGKQTIAQLADTIRQLRKQGTAQGLAFDSAFLHFRIGDVPRYRQAAADRAKALRIGSTGRRVGNAYVIVVQIVLPHQTKPIGTLTIAVPAALVDGTVARDTRTLYAILAAGLAALWLILLPIVASASRKLRRQSEDNQRLARTDALTGLPNRAWFQEQLAATAARGPVGAMVVDVDDFKSVNDGHGHHVGDAVLQAVADRLRAAVRGEDVVGRLGGDEFSIALATDDLALLAEVAERVITLVAAPIVAEGALLEIGVSVGVAVAHGDGPANVDQLMREADRAMYRAKSAGGSRSELELVDAA